MQLDVLLWILGGGFTGTWGLCIFFMMRTDNAMNAMRIEIRQEMNELFYCVKEHHSRISVLESKDKKK